MSLTISPKTHNLVCNEKNELFFDEKNRVMVQETASESN